MSSGLIDKVWGFLGSWHIFLPPFGHWVENWTYQQSSPAFRMVYVNDVASINDEHVTSWKHAIGEKLSVHVVEQSGIFMTN